MTLLTERLVYTRWHKLTKYSGAGPQGHIQAVHMIDVQTLAHYVHELCMYASHTRSATRLLVLM